MKGKNIAIALAATLGIGVVQAKDVLKFPECKRCHHDGFVHKEGQLEQYLFWETCQRTGDYCEYSYSGCSETNPADMEKAEIIKDAFNAIKGDSLRMTENKEIALKITDVNPWAAQSFLFIYTQAADESREILENSEFMGMNRVDPKSFTPENAKKFIHLFHDKKQPSPEDATRLIQAGNAKIHTVHEVTKSADGGAWLAMRISAVDAQDYTEISRILPDVRVKLRRVEDEKGGHWEPIGWEY